MRRDELHRDRRRAESFGAIAEDYERWRPGHPEALFDDLTALGPRQVLDVGCGTGKVAVDLLRRGLPVLGVEPDPQMARIARRNGVPVEVGAFERWDDRGRRYDLLTCGSAWHWLDPTVATAKAATVLSPGGTLARFWSSHELDDDTRAAFEAVYRRYAPSGHTHGGSAARPDGWSDPVAAGDAFTAVEARSYHRDRTFTADEWLGMVTTFSDHQQLTGDERAAVLTALRMVIDARGGLVRARAATLLLLARRAASD